MSDPILFYLRLVKDLKRVSAMEPPDPCLASEIIEAKEELQRLLCETRKEYDAYTDGLTLVPAIRKCQRCGMRL